MDAHRGGIARHFTNTPPKERSVRRRNLSHFVSPGAKLAQSGAPSAVRAVDLHEMVSRLITRMRQGVDYPWGDRSAWKSYDNTTIPSGYTYLAQLAAHDMVAHNTQLSMISTFPGDLRRDYRVQRLVLDTIYGSGPESFPVPYAVGGVGSPHRCLFRLGHVRDVEPAPYEKVPPTPLMHQPARDIPRCRCPFLSDHPDVMQTPDALIADARNDQHVIISQLTAFFHELHNITFAKVRALQTYPTRAIVHELYLPQRANFGSDSAFRQAQDDMAFLQTRKLVVYIYRKIIREDLLRRLLEKGVYDYYTDAARRFPGDLAFQPLESQVPAEFSHAVYRFGHVMTRIAYSINGTLLPTPSIEDLLKRSGGRNSARLPLAATWLVDWSRFFDLGGGAPLNYARRISPFIDNHPLASEGVAVSENGQGGGLFHLDFMRGYEADVSSVADLIAALNAKRLADVARSDLLRDANFREHELGRWLTYVPDVGFKPEESVELTKNPPLLLFVLLEAASTHAGKRLGILGSTMVADVFFGALADNNDVIEGDPAVPLLAKVIFGTNLPSTMPALVIWLKANGGLLDVATGSQQV